MATCPHRRPEQKRAVKSVRVVELNKDGGGLIVNKCTPLAPESPSRSCYLSWDYGRFPKETEMDGYTLD